MHPQLYIFNDTTLNLLPICKIFLKQYVLSFDQSYYTQEQDVVDVAVAP